MTSGDPIWYRPALPGYGWGRDIPGEFVRATRTRFVVNLWRKDGTRVRVAVAPSNVRPRDPDAIWK